MAQEGSLSPAPGAVVTLAQCSPARSWEPADAGRLEGSGASSLSLRDLGNLLHFSRHLFSDLQKLGARFHAAKL